MKYVVIFKAKIKTLDEQYSQTAQLLREKALSQFNCQKFEAISEHHDAEHQVAQQLGKEQWYQSFSVEICKIERHYTHSVHSI